jgi:NTP pyrophosphatase (non-canonical NTP hydrolase)
MLCAVLANTEMGLSKYQDHIDKVSKGQGGYWHPLSILARITEEVGEVARLLNHIYGDKPKKKTEAEQELGEEIADVMYALICLANREKIDLDTAMQKVIQKAESRDKNRFNTNVAG